MPNAPPRPCTVCGRPGCDVHRRPAWGHAQPVKRITGERLQQLRLALWAKDPHCAKCRRLGLPDEMIRDHIANMVEGGTEDEANTQLLCKSCHHKKTMEEARRGIARSRW